MITACQDDGLDSYWIISYTNKFRQARVLEVPLPDSWWL